MSLDGQEREEDCDRIKIAALKELRVCIEDGIQTEENVAEALKIIDAALDLLGVRIYIKQGPESEAFSLAKGEAAEKFDERDDEMSWVWMSAKLFFGRRRADRSQPDSLSDFPEEGLEALRDLVMPLEELPQSDRLLRMIEKALEVKRRGA